LADAIEAGELEMNMARLSVNGGAKAVILIIRAIVCGLGCLVVDMSWQAQAAGAVDQPPYDSTVDTAFDIIEASDPTTFACLAYVGRGQRQIWDKRVDNEPVVNAFLFLSRYDDGTSIEIAINPEFGTKMTARDEALRYASPLGMLPTVLRKGIHRLSVHKGEEGFHAGTGQIVVYSGTADDRSDHKHLEESLFHESVHASLDDEHRLSTLWRDAQTRDGRFLTFYAQKSPEREDLAETALFAYAILHHPERFPPVDTADTLRAVPNRIDYIKRLLPPHQAIFHKVGDARACGPDAK
jgi:hypothetical protein